jgi:hypothetical protein
MPEIEIPRLKFTIPVHNLTGSPLHISVPLLGGIPRNFDIKPYGTEEVDRDLFIMGRAIFQDLRRRKIIYYEDHVQLPCDEQELACTTGILGGTGQGATGIMGAAGATGTGGITGTAGTQGTTGSGGSPGATGAAGVGVSQIFNSMDRYQVETETDAEVWVVSISDVFTNFTWSRATTTLTVTRTAHGHTIGDRVILRKANVDYTAATINAVTANTFAITVPNSGPSAGSTAYYKLGFTYNHDPSGTTKTGGELFAPTGGEVQLVSMRIRTGERAGTVYDVVVPASVTSGAGSNTGLDDTYIPQFQVRRDEETLAAIAATIGVNQDAEGYSTFRIGNLGNGSLSRFILLQF